MHHFFDRTYFDMFCNLFHIFSPLFPHTSKGDSSLQQSSFKKPGRKNIVIDG